jgi:pyruvate dehydrogenase E2 component (dihydrolipoamide acetyltransferase)
MTEAQRLRAELLPSVEKAAGVRLSPTDIIVKAAAGALRDFPYVNAHLDGDAMTLFDDIHIGLAVSLGEGGLIVPVIKDAGRRGLAEIAKARQDLAARARAGQLGGEDVTGGTFTVTNLGAYGVESFNPIINPPQVAILGVGAIADRVVARSGAPTVRPMMGLSLSFDHRAMDGAPAAAFLQRLQEILENPYLLLL